MKIEKQRFTIITPTPWGDVLKHLERCGRVCYKSQHKITENSAEEFVRKLIKSKHESVLEHFSLTIRFVMDRGLLGEITRHRHLSFSVESSRYVNYKNSDIKFIYENNTDTPVEYDDSEKLKRIKDVFECAEKNYKELIELGYKPQEARKVLPMGLATELYVSGNIRAWRHVFKLRCAKAAHPEMRALMTSLLFQLRKECPALFDDICADIIENEHS